MPVFSAFRGVISYGPTASHSEMRVITIILPLQHPRLRLLACWAAPRSV